jgi:hypothetical protein
VYTKQCIVTVNDNHAQYNERENNEKRLKINYGWGGGIKRHLNREERALKVLRNIGGSNFDIWIRNLDDNNKGYKNIRIHTSS